MKGGRKGTFSMDYNEDTEVKFAFGDNSKKLIENAKFKNNMISTTKYNLVTWLPKSLLLQFKRTANIYFLIISILTLFDFSPKNPVTMIGTFAVVLIFTMLKEGYEDIKRYRQDKEMNTKFELIYNEASQQFEKKLWQDLRVGDIAKILKGESIAADMLFMCSSLESGMCSLDTMNLDGETNLKEKYSPKYISDKPLDEILRYRGHIICDIPSADLDHWSCSVVMEHEEERILCDLKHLLLKGCVLKNTEFIIGCIVYTGHNTKIMKNAKPPPIKMSNIMRLMNKLLFSVFFVQLLLCLLFSVGYNYWLDNTRLYLWYIPVNTENQFILKFLTFLLAYSHLIPISLYVALELVKLIQSLLILYDTKMEDPLTKKPALARTSDLIEELGQVEFIFSDKTGTLTKNEMIFRKCFINSNIYGNLDLDTQHHLNTLNPEERKTKLLEYEKTQHTINGDPRAYLILNSAQDEHSYDKKMICDFFIVCSVCHSAYLDNKDGQLIYQSSSPDEVALLEGARQMGFVFTKKSSKNIEVSLFNNDYYIWELILEFPFDSTRKRMSVIVRESQGKDPNAYLFTKGADTEMLKKMKSGEDALNTVKSSLDGFAREGLRTLVLAKKVLKENEVKEIQEKHRTISLLSGSEKDRQLQELFETVEDGFTCVGCSAIEDKLQDGVGETIEVLMNANLKLWVLTGDKKETAIEIGKSCKLILPEEQMDYIDLASSSNIRNQEEFSHKVEEIYEVFVNKNSSFENGLPWNRTAKKKIFIIIDGINLNYVFAGKELSKKFFQIGLLAHSVICCRVSPAHKAKVVKLAKDNGTWITLSIGDGANDVPMIMEAHIGVGISGKEGTQAVRSADYSIGQFRFLKRLVLLHGRWGYRRIAYFICYYFYKNIVLVCTEIYFAMYNGFSGQIFFPDLLPLCYNAFWTSWPCVFAYSIEKDVDEEDSFKYPELYAAGQKKFYFNLKNFWLWIANAIIHGVITFYMITKTASSGMLNNGGMYQDHWTSSTLCFSCLINIVTLKIFIDLMHWNYLTLIASGLSMVFYYFCLCIYCARTLNKLFQNELIEKFWIIAENYKTIIIFLFLPCLALLPDITLKLVRQLYHPTPAELVKQQRLNEKDIDRNLSQCKRRYDESQIPIVNFHAEGSNTMKYINDIRHNSSDKKYWNDSIKKSSRICAEMKRDEQFLVEEVIRKKKEEKTNEVQDYEM